MQIKVSLRQKLFALGDVHFAVNVLIMIFQGVFLDVQELQNLGGAVALQIEIEDLALGLGQGGKAG